jgi:hypothetical protein
MFGNVQTAGWQRPNVQNVLNEFLTSNRDELTSRCRQKVVNRFVLSEAPPTNELSVHLLLAQIAEMLRREQYTESRNVASPEPPAAHAEIGRAATLHGTELPQLGYSIDQMVHDYGDICRAMTELAVDQKVSISADAFRMFNRCLDNAIADAATAFSGARQTRLDS